MNDWNGAGLETFHEVPPKYYQKPMPTLLAECRETKKKLGDDLLILAHHYQQDDTYSLADHSGDSLKLAQIAADSKAKYIVFCGVHFMVESADILTRDDQIAILPALTAGCSMADMADMDQIEDCWEHVMEVTENETMIPVTYINSAASLKAFVAKKGGVVCTSSNSAKILTWAFSKGKRVFFFPDQHLGRNTAKAMGIPKEQMALWDRAKDDGGLSAQQIRQSKILLWDGYCSVHQRFSAEQIRQVRQRIPGVQVMVHPECTEETVDAADFSGSTSAILNKVREAKPGTKWAIGTEINMVHRMAKELKAAPHHKYIEVLNPNVCICSTMYRNHPAHVAYILDGLSQGKVMNQILVEPETARLARQALQGMLELSR